MEESEYEALRAELIELRDSELKANQFGKAVLLSHVIKALYDMQHALIMAQANDEEQLI